jgi:AcrR family transcriptional regulator
MSAGSAESDPRKERARATRRRIVEAAYRLFCQQGFSVPLTAIAAEADVAVQTIYFIFHTKVALLGEALRYAVHGDDLPIPPHHRPWFAVMQAAPDPHRAIEVLLEATEAIYDRVGPLAGVFNTGTGEVAEMWRHSEELRFEGMSYVVDALITKGKLRTGVDRAAVADMVFVLLSPETYQAFVHGRGWSALRWRTWTATTLAQAIFATGV